MKTKNKLNHFHLWNVRVEYNFAPITGARTKSTVSSRGNSPLSLLTQDRSLKGLEILAKQALEKRDPHSVYSDVHIERAEYQDIAYSVTTSTSDTRP